VAAGGAAWLSDRCASRKVPGDPWRGDPDGQGGVNPVLTYAPAPSGLQATEGAGSATPIAAGPLSRNAAAPALALPAAAGLTEGAEPVRPLLIPAPGARRGHQAEPMRRRWCHRPGLDPLPRPTPASAKRLRDPRRGAGWGHVSRRHGVKSLRPPKGSLSARGHSQCPVAPQAKTRGINH
jgi:hypothetical protein